MPVDIRQKAILEEIANRYPNLHASMESVSGEITLRGKFPVVHEGQEVDCFYIEIDIPPDFPETWPRVWETNGRIPRTLERHVNRQDGTLCVMLPDEAYMRYSSTTTILDYFDGPLRYYFLGQMCFEGGLPWPWGEHRHGAGGCSDYYCQLLDVSDPRASCALLLLVYEGRYKGHWTCPCGSRRIIRHCHGPILKSIGERVPKQHLGKAIVMISEAYSSAQA